MLFILSSMLDLYMLVSIFIIIYFIRNLILHLPMFSMTNPWVRGFYEELLRREAGWTEEPHERVEDLDPKSQPKQWE
jgi:hypothetical protein